MPRDRPVSSCGGLLATGPRALEGNESDGRVVSAVYPALVLAALMQEGLIEFSYPSCTLVHPYRLRDLSQSVNRTTRHGVSHQKVRSPNASNTRWLKEVSGKCLPHVPPEEFLALAQARQGKRMYLVLCGKVGDIVLLVEQDH
jgi:hypothetical protein